MSQEIVCLLYVLKYIVCIFVCIKMQNHTQKDFSFPVSLVLSVSAYHIAWQLFDEVFNNFNISL